MTGLKDLFANIGSAVGAVRDCVQLVKELLDVFGKELAQLTEAEGKIDSKIKTQLTNMIRQCEKSAKVFETHCQFFLSRWEQLTESVKRGIDRGVFLSPVQALISDAAKINLSYAKLQEDLQSALTTAANLAEESKKSINEAKDARSDTVVLMGLGGISVALCCALTAALSGFVMVPLIAGGSVGCLFVFKAYDRVTRLNELIGALRGHLAQLEEKIRELNSQANSVAEKATGVEILSNLLQVAEAEIIRKLREQEEIEKRAQKVCVPME